MDTKVALNAFLQKNDMSSTLIYQKGHHNDLGNQIIAKEILKELSRKYEFQLSESVSNGTTPTKRLSNI